MDAKVAKNVATLLFNSGGGLIWLFPVDLFVKRGWDQNSMKKKKKTPNWSEIRKTKIALRPPPGGTECHLCFIIYREAIHFVPPPVLPFTAAQNYALPVVELFCSTAQEINNSAKAEYRSLALAGTRCQGLFWWHHHCCHTRCGRMPVGRAASRVSTHARLRLPFYPITKVSPIKEPRGVALRRQIIRDDFILITFCLIFFYRRGATPHWLWNIPQVGACVQGTQIEICTL